MRKYKKLDKKIDLFDEAKVKQTILDKNENKDKNKVENIDNMVKFAKNLCLCLDDKDINESDLVRDNDNLSKASINAYIKGEQVLSADKLITIAKYFNVSTDFLLGLTECSSVEEDVKMVHEVTGLDEEAITKLSDLNSDIKSGNMIFTDDKLRTINLLINQENRFRIIENISNYLWLKFKGTDEEYAVFENGKLVLDSNREIITRKDNKNISLSDENSGETIPINTELFNNLFILEVQYGLSRLKSVVNGDD